MQSIVHRYRRHRALKRAQGRGRDGCDWTGCADCGSCADCSPLLLSPLLLLLHVVPGAFRAEAVDPWTGRPDGVLARAVARLIRSYQLNVSVPRGRAVCSMTPSCSRYGLQAVSRHGAWRGGLLVLGRLRRCADPSRPRDGSTYDPVPGVGVAAQP